MYVSNEGEHGLNVVFSQYDPFRYLIVSDSTPF